MDVRLWHVVPQNELHRMPRGHWMITGGCNVGLRAMVMARLMGYVDVHVFGMDCSLEKLIGESIDNGRFHVNSHPNEPKKKSHRIVKVGGQEFWTCDIFVECCRQFFKETMLLSDTRVTLHGDGLLQALVEKRWLIPAEIEKRQKFIQERGGTDDRSQPTQNDLTSLHRTEPNICTTRTGITAGTETDMPRLFASFGIQRTQVHSRLRLRQGCAGCFTGFPDLGI